MNVKEYSDLYGMSERAVYHAVYAGRLQYTRIDGRLEFENVPPAVHPRFRKQEEITGLSDYVLALLWFTATISGDSILVRHKNPNIPDTISKAIKATVWTSDSGRRILKIPSATLCAALSGLGFTGKKDLDRNPPPVDELALAKAFTETHSCLGFALQYERYHSGDKDHAFYTPRVTLCAAPAIIESYSLALTSLNIAPLKRWAKAANGKSAIYTVTVREQLENMSTVLSPDYEGLSVPMFWDRFNEHAASPTIPYHKYHSRD